MSPRTVMAVVALLSVLSACRGGEGSAPPVKSGRTMADSAEQVMLGVRFLLTEDGVQRGEMFADTAYIFEDNTRFELRNVRATFNNSVGMKDGVLSADRGRYSMRDLILEGFGNVVIVTNEGRRLTTPQIRYTKALNEVASDTNFTLVEPGGRTVSGVGFRADPQLSRVRVLREFRGGGSITLPAQ